MFSGLCYAIDIGCFPYAMEHNIEMVACYLTDVVLHYHG